MLLTARTSGNPESESMETMAKARIAFGMTLTALVGGLAGAVEPLKLEDYVPADFHRRYLSAEPRLSWNENESETEMGLFRRKTSNDWRFGALHLKHGSERFSQDFRWRIDCGSGLDFNGYGNGEEDRRKEITSSSYSQSREDANFRYSAFTRLYAQEYLRGRFFVAPGFAADWHHSPEGGGEYSSWWLAPYSIAGDSSRFIRYHTGTDLDEIRLSGNARLEAGFGRIQDVRFAETGLFILDRLAETTGQPLALDAAGMRELEAAVEARRKQRPFLDFRRAAIYDLETVAAFLQERRGGEALPARTVLEMADEWHYGGMHSRKSGWEAKAYPFAEWRWNEVEETSHNWEWTANVPGLARPDSLLRAADAAAPAPRRTRYKRFDAEKTLGAGARADWHRPWRRYWQFNAMAFGRAARVEKEMGEKRISDSAGTATAGYRPYIEFVYPAFEAGASLEAAWYPDSRSSLSATAGLGWSRTLDYLGSKASLSAHLGETPVRKTVSARPSLLLSGEYWVSPRMIATCKAEYAYHWNDGQGAIEYLPEYGRPLDAGWTSGSSLRLDASLRYYLF